MGALFVLLLLPIWCFDYFPSQDGPVHLYSAWLFKHLADPDWTVVQSVFTASYRIPTNWMAQFVLSLLLNVTDVLT
ncbi:MAG: hypothetical protein KC476_11305, partial [Cyanobacteria bacterium HKST-UBA06]|nr:hypothetical protein [Cyanobacteria bacterium HKST-UBA06]